VLSNGQVVFRGSAVQASEFYVSSVTSRRSGLVDLTRHPGRTKYSTPVVHSIALLSEEGNSRYTESVKPGEDLVFEIGYDTGHHVLDNAVIGIHSPLGDRVFTVGARYCSDFNWRMVGKGTLTCRVRGVALAPGDYSVMVAMGNRIQRTDYDTIEDALSFRVEAGDYFGTGEALLPGQGHFAVRSEWSVIPSTEAVATLAGV